MVPHSFNNGIYTGIPYTKTLSGNSPYIRLSRRSPVKGGIAYDDVLLRVEPCLFVRINDYLPPG
jgi:hypothetical protein